MILRFLATFLVMAFLQAASFAADKPEMPVGVYLSWELAHAYAKENQVPLDEFLDQSLALCAERGVNILWVTNIDAADLPSLQNLCERHGISLLANACEGKVPALYEDGASGLRQAVERMADAASPTLGHWIVSDEPEGRHVLGLVEYVEMLRRRDPMRKCSLVVTAGMVREIIGKVPVDMAAVDPYPFFGPGDPNGPHTRESSEAYYRNTSETFVAECRKALVEPWLMMQSFAEVWGPYRYSDDGQLIALPGSYLHWVTPGISEIRWQVFEALRQGAQGLVFFQLVPTMLPENGSLSMPDVPWKDVLVKDETSAGYAALLTLHGKPTPQFDEIGALFRLIRLHSSMLLGARPVVMPEWLGERPATVATAAFAGRQEGRTFVILVNDDLTGSVRVGLSEGGLLNLVTGDPCPGTVELPPGGGAILVKEEDGHAIR